MTVFWVPCLPFAKCGKEHDTADQPRNEFCIDILILGVFRILSKGISFDLIEKEFFTGLLVMVSQMDHIVQNREQK